MIGRSAQLAIAQRLLEDAVGGRGTIVIFSGEAGIGKTTLLRSIAGSARTMGFDVRQATGTPSETNLATAALLTLLMPDIRAGFDPVLSSALGIGGTDGATAIVPFQVATSLTAHLDRRAQERPILLMVDDLQWIDPSSAVILLLAARRLTASRVVVAFGQRTEPQTGRVGAATDDLSVSPASRLDLSGILDSELGPLTANESFEMLCALGIAPDRSHELSARAGGSPIALSELARQSHTGQVDATINVPSSYSERIAALSPERFFVCSVVALDEDLAVVRTLASNRGIQLDDAISTSLFDLTAARISFQHPLIRAAVLRTQTPSERRARHVEIAEALDPIADADRVALHRAAGTVGTDDTVATLMVDLALRAKARGALLESSRAMLRAAELTTGLTERMRRMLAGAESRYFNGEPVPAIEIARSAKALSVNEALVAEADLLIATAAEWELDLGETTRELVRLAEYFRLNEPSRSVAALGQASAMAFLVGNIPQGIEFGKQTVAIAVNAGDPIGEFTGRAHLGWNLLLAGRPFEASEHLAVVEPLMNVLANQEDSVDALLVAQRLSMERVIEGQWEAAEALLITMTAQARRMGVRLSATMLSMVRGALCWRCGRWDEAYPLATSDLYSTPLPAVSMVWGSAAAAQITAAMGRDEETAKLVEAAVDGGTRFTAPLVLAWAYAARGHLDLSLQRFDAALVSFDRVASLVSSMGLVEPGFFLWHGDRIETLIRLERFDEASAEVNDLRHIADATQREWPTGIVARASAQLHRDPLVAEALFAESVEIFTRLGMPFEVARTNLAAGQWAQTVELDGSRFLHQAEAAFRALGAAHWMERATEALQRPNTGQKNTGLKNTGQKNTGQENTGQKTGQQALFSPLSNTERRVASAAASGKTNRESAEELGMSPRTVEFHMSSIYKKLGVARRSEFIALLARETT